MATTTPNYGWSVPTSSDLVKNGATDIETLGDSVDASLWNSGYGQAGKNKIINGDFKINQRAFTTTTTTSVFMEDRWQSRAAGDGTTTHSVQTFTPGAAPVAGYEATNYHRIVTTGQTSSTVFSALVQPIESVRTFAGQTVTVSFWAKANSGTPNIGVLFIQSFGSGGSANVTTTATKKAITTSWARYSYTVNIPSISGKTIGSPDGTLTMFLGVSTGTDVTALFDNLGIQTNTFEFWGVQVEYGSKATPFQTASGGSPQAELAMCQRYYWRFGGDAAYQRFGSGIAGSTTVVFAPINNPVPLRVAATSVDYSTLAVSDAVNTPTAVTSVALNAGTSKNITQLDFTVASGLTQYRIYQPLTNNSTSGYLGVSAEL
jgi:hypothetical protein